MLSQKLVRRAGIAFTSLVKKNRNCAGHSKNVICFLPAGHVMFSSVFVFASDKQSLHMHVKK